MQENETAATAAAEETTEATETAETTEAPAAEPTAEPTEETQTESATTEPATAEAEEIPEEEQEEITYHAVQKDGSVTAIWEMQGQKHIRTIDPRSREGLEILRLFTEEEGEEAA